LAWHLTETNQVGTDDFLQWCEREGYEPFLCINMGSGSLDEAQGWVEYCNAPVGTYWADKRAANGHPEPYGVKLWALGNEMYGEYQIGSLPPEEYVTKARQFAAVMRRTDPSITLIGCGKDGLSEWDRIVLEGLADVVDMHSIHTYTGSPNYWVNQYAPYQAERALRRMRELIRDVTYRKGLDKEITISYDEWNVWYRYTEGIFAPSDQPPLEERYDLSDALAVATYMNIMLRNADIIGMANLAQMVNVIAPIFTNKDGLFKQTIYYPFQAYATHTRDIVVDTWVHDGPQHELEERPEWDHWLWKHPVADMGPFQILDTVASIDESGRELTLAVVNHDDQNSQKARVEILESQGTGPVKVSTITGPNPDAQNDFERTDVATQETEVQASELDNYEFPPHSITLMRIPLA
jgi:alpha-N-arabinofuranosidase